MRGERAVVEDVDVSLAGAVGDRRLALPGSRGHRPVESLKRLRIGQDNHPVADAERSHTLPLEWVAQSEMDDEMVRFQGWLGRSLQSLHLELYVHRFVPVKFMS